MTMQHSSKNNCQLLHMKLNRTFAWILFFITSAGCTQRAYYQSPMHGNTNGYKAMPLKNDNSGPAFYADLSLTTGWANENLKDKLVGLSGGFHRAHAFGNFQAFYGSNAVFGRYQVGAFYPQFEDIFWYINGNLNDSLINSLSGPKSFASIGLFGGINLVRSFVNGGEWRVIGAEFAWQNEWGNYYDFRNKLPVTAANINDYNQNYSTISLTSDIIAKLKNDETIGYKVALGFPARRLTYFNTANQPSKILPYNFSQTLHMGFKKINLHTQVNLGYYMFNMQVGLSYRLR